METFKYLMDSLSLTLRTHVIYVHVRRVRFLASDSHVLPLSVPILPWKTVVQFVPVVTTMD